MRLILIVLYVLVIAGCARIDSSTGTLIDESKVLLIEEDVTKQAQIISWFGEPSSVSTSSTGEIYVYLEMHTKSSSVFLAGTEATTKMKTLSVNFDKLGKVTYYSFNKTNSQVNLK